MPSSTLNAESSSGEKLAPKRPVMTAAVVAIGTSPTNKSPYNGFCTKLFAETQNAEVQLSKVLLLYGSLLP